jgi:hypothetical protein
METKTSWWYSRTGVPAWAVRILEQYGAFYGKTPSEILREAAVEKAMSLSTEFPDPQAEVDHGNHAESD